MSSTVPAAQAKFKTLTEALDNNISTTHAINYLGSNNKESNVNFSELKSRALGILFNLQKHNIKPGEQLIIHSDNNELFLDGFWAGLYGGITPVPVSIATNDEHRYKLLRIFNKLESPWLYTDSETLNKILAFCDANNLTEEASQLRSKSILIDEIDDVSQLGEQYAVKPDDIAFIQFSSGSTSEPKGVVLTHKNIMTNIHAIIAAAEFTQADKFFGWMPLTHDLGMIGFHLTPLVLGVDHTIMETNVFVRRPLLWLTAVSQKQATTLCSPNFGYKHFLKVFKAKGMEQIDLSHVHLIFNGAEPISIEICEQFLTAMASHGLKTNTMYPVYGLAEACLAVSFPKPGDEIKSIKLHREHLAIGDTVNVNTIAKESVEFVLTGRPINDCHVRITNEDNQVLGCNTVGRIQLKGDNVTHGYYLEDKINQQIISQDGWLDTGDLGAFVSIDSNSNNTSINYSDADSSAQLIITGRMKDIIFVNGLNFYSHDLENILHTLDDLELGKVIATGARKPAANEDEVIIFILHRGKIETFVPLIKAIRKKINASTGIEVHEIIPVKRIPKTTSGKVQRRILNDEYVSGYYDDLIAEINATLTVETDKETGIDIAQDCNTLDNKILQFCNSAVEDKSITLDDNLFEIGISSLALAEIHEAIDEAFPGKVDIADLFDHPTVRELSSFLQKAIT